MLVYLGNCIDSFDENGDSLVPGLYHDVSNFAWHAEHYVRVTKKNFDKRGTIDPRLDRMIGLPREYFIDPDLNLYIIYNYRRDIHYFFREERP